MTEDRTWLAPIVAALGLAGALAAPAAGCGGARRVASAPPPVPRDSTVPAAGAEPDAGAAQKPEAGAPSKDDIDPPEPKPDGRPRPPPEKLGKAQEQFGLDLYAELAKEKPGQSFVFSPASLAMALSMAYGGARGETAAQMQKVLHLPDDPALPHEWYQKWLAFTWLDRHGPKAVLHVHDRLWLQQGFALRPAYVELMKTRYFVGWSSCDFKHHYLAEQERIKAYVRRATGGMIEHFPLHLDPTTRLVITNTLLLKVAWPQEFDKKKTKPGPFHLAGGRTVQLPMMHGTLGGSYASDKDLEIARIPYRIDNRARWELVIAMPRDPSKLGLAEARIRKAGVARLVKQLSPARLVITMPKVSVRSALSLAGELAGLGMTDAFDDFKADFTGMAPGLEIGDVVHSAKIMFHERGTDAAAATAVVMELISSDTGPVPPVVHLELRRPFVFCLRDARSGTLIMLGRFVGS